MPAAVQPSDQEIGTIPMTTNDNPESARRYYRVQWSEESFEAPQFEWTNMRELSDWIGLPKGPHEFGIGMPDLAGTPVLTLRGEGVPLDFYYDSRNWIISDRAKAIFEGADPEAFEFMAVATDPELPQRYWFADIVRLLDCVDEDASQILYQPDISWKVYEHLSWARMRPEIIGKAHAFRLRLQRGYHIVDDIIRDAAVAARLTGIAFELIPGSEPEFTSLKGVR